MKFLSKDDVKSQTEHIASIRKAAEAVTAAIDAYNEAMGVLKDSVESAAQIYNEAIDGSPILPQCPRSQGVYPPVAASGVGTGNRAVRAGAGGMGGGD